MLIATAGHVDHGKSSLVQALTGVNTDRLDEEKRRGLSIELGFAFKNAGDENTIGFIDVPGHHRFMNTMIAGVTGIDLGMIVVAADDGPMPQTLEHLQILRLLGVENFLAVISKVDLVDQTRVEDVASQIQSLLPGAKICKISTKTNVGINSLLNVLLENSAKCHNRQISGNFRMYIDRAFTKKGAGLVVTGTALSGCVNIGDELYLHTEHNKTAVRVRSIHAQGGGVASGYAGQRCALNLTGKISVDDTARGNFLYASADALPADRLDSRFWPAETAPRNLKHMGRVKLYIGSRRINARSYLLSRVDETLNMKDTTGQRVQFILDKGVIAFAGDRFLIRDDSEHCILGGGVVIDPIAPKWGKANTDRIMMLDALEGANAKGALAKLVLEKDKIINLKYYQRIQNITDSEIKEILETSPFGSENFIQLSCKGNPVILSINQWTFYKTNLNNILIDWHKANPQIGSIAIDKLKALPKNSIPAIIFSDVLNDNIRSGEITQNENQVRITGSRPILNLRVEKDWARLNTLMQNRLPLRSEIEKELGFDARKIDALTRSKLKAGIIFEIGEKRLALSSTLRAMAAQISKISNPEAFTIIDAKKELGLGRGQTIEILEFFDTIKYTVRRGNSRSVVNFDIVEQVLKI